MPLPNLASSSSIFIGLSGANTTSYKVSRKVQRKHQPLKDNFHIYPGAGYSLCHTSEHLLPKKTVADRET